MEQWLMVVHCVSCVDQLLYASGRYELARQYFAQAVELKPNNNLRALYGIIMVRPTPQSHPFTPSPSLLIC